MVERGHVMDMRGEKRGFEERKIDQSLLRDLLEWDTKVVEGLDRIHGESEVGVDMESEGLRELRAFLDADLDDEEFREQLDDVTGFLPGEFEQMHELFQNSPHRDIDVFDHTFNMLRELDTSGLNSEDRLIARTVGFFHDIGKVKDAFDREHPRKSVEMIGEYLVVMGFDEEQQMRIVNHVKWHDMFGEIARQDGRNALSVEDASMVFPNEVELGLHRIIVGADVRSIPGLRRYAGNVDAVHRLMEHRMASEESWVPVRNVLERPEGLEANRDMDDYERRLGQGKEFDAIGEGKLNDYLRTQRERFDALDDYEKEEFERLFVSKICDGDDDMLRMMQLRGRELDRSWVDELESTYGMEFTKMRVATEMFAITYGSWELNNMLRPRKIVEDDGSVRYELDEDDVNWYDVERHVNELRKSAEFLSSYAIEATHSTATENVSSIENDGALRQSVSLTNNHYEGDGVYMGVLGSFDDYISQDHVQNYSDTELYRMRIPLADTFPIMIRFIRPEAMVNVLCETVDINNRENYDVVAHGLRQWRHEDYQIDDLQNKKLEILESQLGVPVHLLRDETDNWCLTADTELDPIIWGTICRGLRIRRFIPQSELRKAKFSKWFHSEERWQDFRRVETADGYEEAANSVRGIKGVKGKDRVEY